MATKKVLFTSHTANFSKFNRPFMRWFKEQGYQVHYASAGEEEVLDCDKHHKVCFNRTPWSVQNIAAYKQLKKIIDSEKFDIIHTHTPMGSVVTRLAARKTRKRNATKVIYTAHGFHFYSGAPLINWLIYYPVEKMLARHLDVLITINAEDYARAKAHFRRVGKIHKIDGVGVDLAKFKPANAVQKTKLRKKFDYDQDAFILLCVAEFTTNKSQEFIIESAKRLIKQIPNLKIVFAGDGYRLQASKDLAKRLGLQKKVDFIGYRRDIQHLYALSDALVSGSAREGLPVSVVEAMASGLPIICTRIRGHVDLVTDGRNGILYDVHDARQLIAAVKKIYADKQLRAKITVANTEDVSRFSLDQAVKSMTAIYGEL